MEGAQFAQMQWVWNWEATEDSELWKSEIENEGGRGEKSSYVWRRGTSETQAA